MQLSGMLGAGRRALVIVSLVVAVLTIAGCGTGNEDDNGVGSAGTVSLGPLAVAGPDTPGSPEPSRRRSGVLAIGEECVQLEGDAGSLLLVWHVDRVQWDSGSRSMWFRNDSGSVQRLQDGDRVVLHGGPLAEDIDWFAEPAADCGGDRFAVERVRVRKQG